MTFTCSCDYEPFTTCTISTPVARKEHGCGECSGTIMPGEKYEYVFGISDGEICICKTCPRCLAIRDWVKINIPCFCWGYGNINEDMRETIYAAAYHAPEETVGLRFGLLRRFALRDRHNAAQRAFLSAS